MFVAVFALLAYSFSSAEWTSAPANAPQNNTEAPINISDQTQVKAGNFGAHILATATTTGAGVWAKEYCDEYGENCSQPGGGVNEFVYMNKLEVTSNVAVTNDKKTIPFSDFNLPINTVRVLLSAIDGTIYACSGQGQDSECGNVNTRTIINISGLNLDTPVLDGVNWYTAKNQSLTVAPANAKLYLYGYECSGTCNASDGAQFCDVKFESNLDGERQTNSRIIRDQDNVWVYAYSEHTNSGRWQTGDDIFAIHQRSRGTLSGNFKGQVGYAYPSAWGSVNDAPRQTGIANLSLTAGRSVTVQMGRSSVTATAVSCSGQ